MKTAVAILTVFAGLVVASCGEDSPKVGGTISAPILLPQSQDDRSGEDLNVVGELQPAATDVAVETGDAAETETDENMKEEKEKEKEKENINICCAEKKVEDEQEIGENGQGTDIELFDVTNFAAKIFGNKIAYFDLDAGEQTSQPEPTMVMTESGTPWLVAFELTGRLVQYGLVKPDGNNSYKIEEDAELSFDFKDNSHECLKLFKIEADMVGANYAGEAYSEGLLHITAERCMVSDTAVNKTISPDKLKIDMDDYRFWDPCLGEVVVNGRITCEAINSENKKVSSGKFVGTKWCVTDSVTYEIGGDEYKITMPTGDQPFMATWNGDDTNSVSIFKLKGGIEINGKYASFNFDTLAPAKVLLCLK